MGINFPNSSLHSTSLRGHDQVFLIPNLLCLKPNSFFIKTAFMLEFPISTNFPRLSETIELSWSLLTSTQKLGPAMISQYIHVNPFSLLLFQHRSVSLHSSHFSLLLLSTNTHHQQFSLHKTILCTYQPPSKISNASP